MLEVSHSRIVSVIDVKKYSSNGFTLLRLSSILIKSDGDNFLISSCIKSFIMALASLSVVSVLGCLPCDL